MKQSLKMGLVGLLLTNTAAYALNPVQGWYAGLWIGVSRQPTTQFTLLNPVSSPLAVFPESVQGSLSHGVLGGVGGQVGYRCNHFRIEGEVLYNNNPYKTLTLGDLTIKSPSSSPALRIAGDTNTGAFFFNGFYDLYTPSEDGWSQVVPYVGVGLGYTYVQDALQFYYNDILLNHGDIKEIQRNIAGQGILGVSYFLDDFTTFSLDFRYLTTQLTKHTGRADINSFNTRLQLSSINLVFNGAFDYG